MLKKVWLYLMVLSMVLLTACAPSGSNEASSKSGNSNGNTNSNSSSTGKTDNGGSKEVVNISWWDANNVPSAQAALTKLIADYEKEHPNVKINRTYVAFGDIKKKLFMGAAGNQLPDLVWIDNPDFQSFAAAGILADITKDIQGWEFKDKYYAGPWSSTMYKDKNYGVPNYSNSLAVFYNEDMLKAAGVEPPKTWDELKAAAKKLTKSGVYGFSASGEKTENSTFQFLPYLWQAGSDLTNFDSPGTVDAIKLWKDMVDNGSMSKEILTMDQQAVELQFVSGKAAMMENGTWQIPGLLKDAKFKWGIVQMPTGKNGGATALGGFNWGITSSSKHLDVAWDILKFAEQPDRKKEFLKAAGYLPARKDLINDPAWQNDPNMKIFADNMDVAKARAYGPNYPKISEAVQDMLQQVVSGTKSPEDAVKEAAGKIKPLLP